MNPRSGLTLLEVLVSLAILSLLAATALPLVRSSVRLLREPRAELDLSELDRVADRLVEDPSQFGFSRLPDQGTVREPDTPAPKSFLFRVLRAQDPKTDHAWLALQEGELAVFRKVPREDGGTERSEASRVTR